MKRHSLDLDRKQMDRVFKYWVRKLGLERWHITWDFFTKEELPADDELMDVQGETVCDVLTHTGIVKLRPLELWPYTDTPMDLEQVAVHEILHIKMDFLWKNLENDKILQDILHELIDDLAWMLVDERRTGSDLLAEKPRRKRRTARKTSCGRAKGR